MKTEKKSSHTPGPWKWQGDTVANHRNDASTQVVSYYDDGSVRGVVAGVGRDGGTYSKEEAQANARIIAAAPDMLLALKSLNFGRVPCGARDIRGTRGGYRCGVEGRLCPHCINAEQVSLAIIKAEGK